MPPKLESCPLPLQQRWRWLWVALFGVIALALTVWGVIALDLRELMVQVVARLRGAGAPLFFIAMASLPAVGFPLLPFGLAAGPVFIPTLGISGVIVCAVLAVAANVAISYFLAATLLRSSMERLLQRLGYSLPVHRGNSAWALVALVRLAPGLPFWAQSYLLGLVRVSFGAYMLVSTLVPASYLAGTIIFGDSIFKGKLGAAFFGTGLVVAAGTAMYFLRRKLKEMRDELENDDAI